MKAWRFFMGLSAVLAIAGACGGKAIIDRENEGGGGLGACDETIGSLQMLAPDFDDVCQNGL
jgi:hypothetical protein